MQREREDHRGWTSRHTPLRAANECSLSTERWSGPPSAHAYGRGAWPSSKRELASASLCERRAMQRLRHA